MKKILLAILIIYATIAISGAVETENKVTKEEIAVPEIETRTIKPVKSPVEKKADWVLENINNLEGWSFTGYAKTSLDERFCIKRWKFGIINAETSNHETEQYYSRHDLFPEREHEPKSLIFGIAFTREF